MRNLLSRCIGVVLRVLIGGESHWEDGKVKHYVSEREKRGKGLEWTRRECMDRERWRSVCHGHPLEGRFQNEQSVRAID